MRRDSRTWSRFAIALAAVIALGLSATARATIVLDFEGLQDSQPVADYYAGGSSSGAAGPNCGVTFGTDAVALISQGSPGGGSLDFGGNPSGDTILHFNGTNAIMNVPGGFSNGFSLYYAPTPEAGNINIYSGLDGTGAKLATVPRQVWYPPLMYYLWRPAGVTFDGVAHSVSFSDATLNSAYDNVTLGSDVPAPEPSTIVLLVAAAVGFLGFTWLRPVTRKSVA